MKFYGISDVGLIRKENQDSIALLKNGHGDLLGVVCDGIGGGKAGDVASQIACDHIRNSFKKANSFHSDIDMKKWLLKIIQEANDLIFMQSTKSVTQKGMGTTCVGVLINNDTTCIFNVGDSRIYGLYDEFVCLTEDHSFVSDLLKNGEITQEEALHHPNRNMLTNALGIWDNVKIDINKIKNDYAALMICSDGLHGYVDEAQICKVISSTMDVKEKVQKLINDSKEVGGYDNVSVIVIEKGDE